MAEPNLQNVCEQKVRVVELLRPQHGEVYTGSSWGSFASEPNLRSEFQASKRPCCE